VLVPQVQASRRPLRRKITKMSDVRPRTSVKADRSSEFGDAGADAVMEHLFHNEAARAMIEAYLRNKGMKGEDAMFGRDK